MLLLSPVALCAGAQQQVVVFAADKQSLQEKLNQHLEAAQSSTAAMHAELTSLRDKAAASEAAVSEAQKQVSGVIQQQRHAQHRLDLTTCCCAQHRLDLTTC